MFLSGQSTSHVNKSKFDRISFILTTKFPATWHFKFKTDFLKLKRKIETLICGVFYLRNGRIWKET